MHHSPVSLSAAAVALLSALPAVQAGLYTKNSPVLQVDGKNYDTLVAKSNYTTIVEFYAPWCGHCQNLKPAYEKAAKNLEGLAHVAAVDCDEDSNKQLCGSMGIKGFPTLKIVRPGKKAGRPAVEDYQGARSATGIVEAVVERINNHVKRVSDKDIDKFLSDKNETAKAILFTDKGTTSALLKSVAIEFLDVIAIAQARNKESKTVGIFGVDKFPSLVLLPGGDKDAVVYEGELKKGPIVKFLSQAGSPNPDPAPAAGSKKSDKKSEKKSEKKAEKKDEKKAEKKDTKPPKAKAEPTKEETEEAATEPTETVAAPIIIESAPPLPTIHASEKLIKECLNEKSHTCVLVFVPAADAESAKATSALKSLSELAHKHAQSKRNLFPFFAVPSSNPAAPALKKSLDLAADVEMIAINARRGWWRHFDAGDFDHASIEGWIDAIRMSEGVKKKLPEGLIAIAMEDKTDSAPKAETTGHDEL